MSMIDRFTFAAQTPLPDLPFATIHPVIRARATEHDLPILRDDAGEICIETAYGTYAFVQEAAQTRVEIGSGRADWLYVLKESLSDTIAELSPAVAAAIRWSDAAASAGNLPPNFQFITVEEVTRIPGGFLRVRAVAEDLSHFTPDAIHFRLALPNPDLAYPEWPSLSDKGLTLWPKGAATLHRPVYTVREMDAASGHLLFDVFEHEGGRATEWARRVTPGTRVGLTGPGGGGIPETRALAIFADETGLPAVARILAALPADASGHVVLEMTDPRSEAYELPQHPGFTVQRRVAGAAEGLSASAIATLNANPELMIWYAAEKRGAQDLRAHLKASGRGTKDHYIAAYWSLPDPAEA
ncbi:siderophore-interacting protein [Arenibacterium sp. LLYu02]|uniref:siderophore-interacting protein n=1 Tax=Arenibacterium sp. LLYu02 TaxID=3404132 RepID=UPI003B20F45F